MSSAVRPGRGKRGLARALLALASSYLFFEALCGASLHLLRVWKGIAYQPLELKLSEEQRAMVGRLIEGSSPYFVHDPDLGWSIRPSARDWPFESNRDGLRASREYSREPSPSTFRIAAFGDSYTHGNDVENRETWAEQLERLDPRLEVLNFGVSGYGVDQALLRYQRDGIAFHPKRVFIGYMSENIVRHVNVFRGFLYHAPTDALAKPRFLLRSGGLVLLPNPLRDRAAYARLLQDEAAELGQLGEHDGHYQARVRGGAWDLLPSVRLVKLLIGQLREHGGREATFAAGRYNPDSEAFRVTLRLLEDFSAEVSAHGSAPVILIFPDPLDLELDRRGEPTKYASLTEELVRRGLRHLDLAEAFDRTDPQVEIGELFTSAHHYSALGNRIVAEFLFAFLQQDLRGS